MSTSRPLDDYQKPLAGFEARNAEAQVQAALATTRAQQKLNALAAWTLPLMMIAAVFGMNLQSGMEAMPVVFFWAVLFAGMLLGMAANGWVQRLSAPKAVTPAKSVTSRPKGTLRSRQPG